MRQRNQVYAHTDATDYRKVLELAGEDWRRYLSPGETGLSEQWVPPDRDQLGAIAMLAAKLANLFTYQAEAIVGDLASQGSWVRRLLRLLRRG